MAKINLRPWREERAAARQKEFQNNIVLSAVFAVLLVFLVGYFYGVQSDRQGERNRYIKSEIAKLDAKITEIKELKKQRARLLERLNAIQELQGNRPVIVRNFDELVRVLPDGLHYSLLERQNSNEQALNGKDLIQIKGLAAENEDVSELMRNLDDSIWFGEPNLVLVNKVSEKSKGGAGFPGMREFDLSVVLTKPETNKDKQQDKAK